MPFSIHTLGPQGSDLPCLEASRQPQDRSSFTYESPVTRAETHLCKGPGLTPAIRIKAQLQIALGKVHIGPSVCCLAEWAAEGRGTKSKDGQACALGEPHRGGPGSLWAPEGAVATTDYTHTAADPASNYVQFI